MLDLTNCTNLTILFQIPATNSSFNILSSLKKEKPEKLTFNDDIINWSTRIHTVGPMHVMGSLQYAAEESKARDYKKI